ncbi:hypothetical protein [Limoniibacter endophyticus]|uniref:Uncharacterized protein n=1 Tax=Limoniibacter endophyticus TaxID=1565040 RepID=A0A8J3DJM2_9HYPH|nr:hypothetical protein [Limoniibacter endophyticus]GHC79035.1 hypothetical protein GCM10010136_31240 [Limoniibacter endophyticus]
MKTPQWTQRAFIFTGSNLELLSRQTDFLNADRRILQSKDLLVYCLDHGGIHIIAGELPDNETPSATRSRFWSDANPEFEAIIVDENGKIRRTFEAPVTAAELDAFLGHTGSDDQEMS